jgi:hypothetical protein
MAQKYMEAACVWARTMYIEVKTTNGPTKKHDWATDYVSFQHYDQQHGSRPLCDGRPIILVNHLIAPTAPCRSRYTGHIPSQKYLRP